VRRRTTYPLGVVAGDVILEMVDTEGTKQLPQYNRDVMDEKMEP
jgi:hypothetical protein